MPDQIIVRENGTVGINIILKWLASEQARAVKLVIVEGIPNSGKSHLGKVAAKKGFHHLECDQLLPHPADHHRSWIDQVVEGGGIQKLRAALCEHGLTVAEGPAIWPVVEQALDREQRASVRRIYIKEMSTSGGVVEWLSGFDMGEHAAACREHQELFWASIYEYHSTGEPWTYADLIFERLPDPD